MNTRRVSISAGRRSGTTFIASILMLVALRQAKGSEVLVTVTGTAAGTDDYRIFGGAIPEGTPFTLVYTVDDRKGQESKPPCPNGGSGIAGAGQSSPVTAVLTIRGKSYIFGRRADAGSFAWRHISTSCSASELAMEVREGVRPLVGGVNTLVHPLENSKSISQDTDWRSAIAEEEVDGQNKDNTFSIRYPQDFGRRTQGVLRVAKIAVSGPKANSAPLPVPVAPAAVPTVEFPPQPHVTPGPPVTRIYVLTLVNNAMLTTYSIDGEVSGPTIPLGYCLCTGIAVNAAGNIFVSAMGPRNNIMTFDPEGHRTTPTLNLAIGAQGVTVGADGTIYVLGTPPASLNSVIKGFTPSGAPSGLLIDTKMRSVIRFTQDAAGTFYLGDPDIVRGINSNGQPVGPILRRLDPRGIAVAPDGRVYVADYVELRTFLPNGERTQPTILRRNPRTLDVSGPRALAVDGQGNLYIGYDTGEIAIYRPDGQLIREFRGLRGVVGIAIH